MGLKIIFASGRVIRITDKEAKEFISKFLNPDILLIENDLEETVYPIISKYRERG